MKLYTYSGISSDKAYELKVVRASELVEGAEGWIIGWFGTNGLCKSVTNHRSRKIYCTPDMAQHALDLRADKMGWRLLDTVEFKP